MNNKEKLEEATIKVLSEDTQEPYSVRIANKCKEENPEFYNVYEQLKQLQGNYDRVTLSTASYGRDGYEISITLTAETEDRHEIYGDISDDKVCKITSSSGPNPLEPKYLELLNKLSNILKGYTFKHY